MSIFQATSKSKDEINHLGKVILEAAKKDAKKKGSKSSSTNLTAKEKEIREKLVMKLKKKAEGDISRQQIKVNRAKNDDFESVSDADLSEELNASNEEMEEISEDDLNKDSSDSDKSSEIDSDEELRLTSTDDDSEGDNKRKKKRKKEKKDKKRRTREKEKDRETRKQREILRQIKLAERIASKRSPVRRSPEYKADLWEHEKYDRERNPGKRERERERTPTGYYGAQDYYNKRRRSTEREEREAAPMDEFERDEYERERFLKASKMKKVCFEDLFLKIFSKLSVLRWRDS